MSDERVAALERTLRAHGQLADGERVTELTQLLGGWSRHSYRAVVTAAGGAQRPYIVRAKPEGALLDTSLHLEYEVFARLNDEDVATPRVYGLEEHETAFGGPYIVMEHLPGAAPNTFNRRDWVWLRENWEAGGTIAEDLAVNLARIHALPVDTLAGAVPVMDYQAVVAHWRGVYDEQRLTRDPVLEEAYDWLAAGEPADTADWTGLVHGDYRVGNCLVEDGRVTAILDWELAYIGDVRFDLGYQALPRIAGKHLRRRSELFGLVSDEDRYLDRYAELTGRVVDRQVLGVFQVLAMAMLVATQLTAVRMFREGRTTDMRMAWSRCSFPGLRQDMIEVMGW